MFGSNSFRTWIEPRLVICVPAVATPSWRAARPVICLKVEPGGYISAITWLSIGLPGSSASLLQRRFVDLAGEQVVVVVGQRHHRQDLAGVHVDDEAAAFSDAPMLSRRMRSTLRCSSRSIESTTLRPGVAGTARATLISRPEASVSTPASRSRRAAGTRRCTRCPPCRRGRLADSPPARGLRIPPRRPARRSPGCARTARPRV